MERLPAPVFWPGEFHELYSPWGHEELDTTEPTSQYKFDPFSIFFFVLYFSFLQLTSRVLIDLLNVIISVRLSSI